jgi:SAM-dependent methyltransferase
MKTYLQLSHTHASSLPPEFQDDDVRYPEKLVRCFLDEYTQLGDRVFDPFAGFGTTLVAAQALGRIGYGLELDQAKLDYARSRLRQPEHLLYGDARRLLDYDLPTFAFSMTSPPFMTRDEIDDPLTDYRLKGRGYRAYLDDLRGVYAQVRQFMQPAGVVVLEVANLKIGGVLTPLAWDVAEQVARVLHFEGEVVVGWDHYGYGYDHSYCLVFSAI